MSLIYFIGINFFIIASAKIAWLWSFHRQGLEIDCEHFIRVWLKNWKERGSSSKKGWRLFVSWLWYNSTYRDFPFCTSLIWCLPYSYSYVFIDGICPVDSVGGLYQIAAVICCLAFKKNQRLIIRHVTCFLKRLQFWFLPNYCGITSSARQQNGSGQNFDWRTKNPEIVKNDTMT